MTKKEFFSIDLQTKQGVKSRGNYEFSPQEVDSKIGVLTDFWGQMIQRLKFFKARFIHSSLSQSDSSVKRYHYDFVI